MATKVFVKSSAKYLSGMNEMNIIIIPVTNTLNWLVAVHNFKTMSVLYFALRPLWKGRGLSEVFSWSETTQTTLKNIQTSRAHLAWTQNSSSRRATENGGQTAEKQCKLNRRKNIPSNDRNTSSYRADVRVMKMPERREKKRERERV